MTEVTTQDLVALFDKITDAIEADKERLCKLDGIIGDADHGVTMSIGFLAVRTALKTLDAASVEPTAVFNLAAKSFLNAVGASSGPLYATAFLRAGASVKGKATLDRDAMVAIVGAMGKGIQDRGKGERGDKTMLDAWLPAGEAATNAAEAGGDLRTCLEAALKAAQTGAGPPRPWSPPRGGHRVSANVPWATWILARHRPSRSSRSSPTFPLEAIRDSRRPALRRRRGSR